MVRLYAEDPHALPYRGAAWGVCSAGQVLPDTLVRTYLLDTHQQQCFLSTGVLLMSTRVLLMRTGVLLMKVDPMRGGLGAC